MILVKTDGMGSSMLARRAPRQATPSRAAAASKFPATGQTGGSLLGDG
jgi:hypothetical protein